MRQFCNAVSDYNLEDSITEGLTYDYKCLIMSLLLDMYAIIHPKLW